MEKVVHKKDCQKRQTICGIQFDDVKDLISFIKRVKSHKRLITCKNCLKRINGEIKND